MTGLFSRLGRTAPLRSLSKRDGPQREYNRAVRNACIFVAAACLCTLASAADGLNKLNVAAVDSQGQPVRGLQSSDFQLQVDGKSRPITFFRFTGGAPLRPTVILIDLLSDRMAARSPTP